jgi:hypothetical protein
MIIQLRENESSIFAGQYIHGNVHVYEKLAMMAYSITLSFIGHEEVSFMRQK